jgi:hypothetical protein
MTVPFTFANASGRVPAAELDANFAYVANNVSTANIVVFAAQPNITSVGNLTSLTVNGSVTSTQYIGNGNALTNIPGANVVGAVTYATTANSVAGANVVGAVTYATTANAVAGANVSGAVALANVANTALAVAGANVSGQVGNALVAGTVYTNAQPNITTVGTLSSLSVTGNVRAGAFYGVSINSSTGNLLMSANVADPDLAWAFLNDYSAPGISSLLGAAADFNKRSEILLPGRFSTGILTFTGPDYVSFPDSLVIAAGENISIAQTPGGLGNVATYVTTFDTDGNWAMPGNVSAVGNVDGNYFTGNGRNLTGILATSSYDDANVTALLSNLGSNVIGGTGNITTTANITGGNVLTGGLISATANITTTANITGGNVLTGGLISATANIITAGYFVGNFVGNITGNLTVPGANTQVLFNSNGNAGATAGLTFDTAGPNLLTVNGNVQSSNLLTTGIVSANGNVTGGNINTIGLITATGNIATSANVLVSGYVSATGNINGGNVLTSGIVSVAGNISTSANVLVGGFVNATANVRGSNITTSGNVSAVGNVLGTHVITSGFVSATGNVTSGNVRTSGLISAAGNVTGGNILTEGLISATGNIIAGNLAGTNIVGTLTTASQTNITSVGTLGSLSVTGNINAGNIIATNLSGPIFLAYQTTPQNLATGTANLIYDTATVNSSNYYDPVTGIFTPLVPGYYQVNATVLPSPGSTGSFFLGLFKNGSALAQGTGVAVQATWGQPGVSSVSVTVPFNGTTDYVNCKIIGTSVVGAWTTTPGVPAYFQACWVRGT